VYEKGLENKKGQRYQKPLLPRSDLSNLPVVVGGLGQALGHYEEGNVELVLQQVADGALGVGNGALYVALDQDLPQAGVHHLTHQQAVVTPHLIKEERTVATTTERQLKKN